MCVYYLHTLIFRSPFLCVVCVLARYLNRVRRVRVLISTSAFVRLLRFFCYLNRGSLLVFCFICLRLFTGIWFYSR